MQVEIEAVDQCHDQNKDNDHHLKSHLRRYAREISQKK